MKRELLLIILLLSVYKIMAQCVSNNANVFSFNVNNIPYEIVKEKKSWVQAAACAVSRGGKLAEINSKAEQDTLFYYLQQAGINPANTVAPDGGGASYVWIGGNDLAFEGKWVWDGDNSAGSVQFWQGTTTGSVVGGLYTNWGNEPDDWNGQDGLGLAITNWPLGLAGQWNDVDEINTLYYIIEYPQVITTSVPEWEGSVLSLFPNPANGHVRLHCKTVHINKLYRLINSSGYDVRKGRIDSEDMDIDLGELSPGLYMFVLENGESYRLMKY